MDDEVTGLDVNMQWLDELCRRYGVARLVVFGSVARGDVDETSDLDLLYELVPGRSSDGRSKTFRTSSLGCSAARSISSPSEPCTDG